MIVEDPNPSGFEPVELHSGDDWYRDRWRPYSHIEYGDRNVSLFETYLQAGRHTFRYRLRAETPGEVHVLPAKVYAMYGPETRGSSSEARLGVRDSLPNPAARKDRKTETVSLRAIGSGQPPVVRP